ncbi:uncharacterized protein EV154DRAFT_606507 [Mucor mucedo]|uniref:uncharacterized protein n=1 Tax=Mucor mucedo TaxID=29922 RepID=UPI00221EB22C|nr:uncharacterized protein EV154DRAFT_606507 [Mucor mucedo]KAI7877868.1 hypothetical protein EV154DRAFT_606507 [Mucor mucedo]
MKFSVISALILGITASVFASDTFDLPAEGSSFTTSDTIRFVTDDVTDDSENKIQAVLFKYTDSADFEPKKTIGLWSAALNTGDEFVFDWRVDMDAGYYSVCVFEIDDDDYDDEDFDYENGDSCSYPFAITGGSPLANSNRKKRSIYAA